MSNVIKVTHQCPSCKETVYMQSINNIQTAPCFTCGKVYVLNTDNFELEEWQPKFHTDAKYQAVRIITKEMYDKMMSNMEVKDDTKNALDELINYAQSVIYKSCGIPEHFLSDVKLANTEVKDDTNN